MPGEIHKETISCSLEKKPMSDFSISDNIFKNMMVLKAGNGFVITAYPYDGRVHPL